MERRPWVLVLVTLFILFSPFLNLFKTYIAAGETIEVFLSYLTLPTNLFKLSIYFIPPLIVAYSIWITKKWSFYLFIFSMSILIIRSNYLYFFTNNMSFTQYFIPTLSNLLFVLYFMIPSVKRVYFDPRLRWWESQTRYKKTVPVELTINEEAISSEFTDISEGGLFCSYDNELTPERTLKIKFEDLNHQFILEGQVVYSKPNNNGHGIQFQHLNSQQKKLLKTYIKELVKNGTPLSRIPTDWKKDLLNWIINLKNGKGFVPNIKK